MRTTERKLKYHQGGTLGGSFLMAPVCLSVHWIPFSFLSVPFCLLFMAPALLNCWIACGLHKAPSLLLVPDTRDNRNTATATAYTHSTCHYPSIRYRGRHRDTSEASTGHANPPENQLQERTGESNLQSILMRIVGRNCPWSFSIFCFQLQFQGWCQLMIEREGQAGICASLCKNGRQVLMGKFYHMIQSSS